MTDIDEKRIAEIEARVERATEGPWAKNPFTAHVDAFEIGEPLPICALLWPTELRTEDQVIADGEFIAHARQDIPDLLAALKAIREGSKNNADWFEQANADRIAAEAALAAANERVRELEALLDRHENGLAQVWVHKKTGGLYRVINHVRIEADNTPAVAYMAVGGGPIWVRPLSEFNDGRFEKVDASEASHDQD